jgi:hypothetical protein
MVLSASICPHVEEEKLNSMPTRPSATTAGSRRHMANASGSSNNAAASKPRDSAADIACIVLQVRKG